MKKRLYKAERESYAFLFKQARKLRGYTQIRLAKEAGVSRQAISLIESGERDPGLSVAVSIMKTLDTDMNVFKTILKVDHIK